MGLKPQRSFLSAVIISCSVSRCLFGAESAPAEPSLAFRAGSIAIAREGRAVATIVIPAKAPERLTLGATELQTYVRKICGVELPIRRDGALVEGTGLYVGRCEPTREEDLPDAALNPETYAIRVRDGNLLFTARHATPTYFAVVSFIEDALGVRWFAPGEEWEYVPTGTPGELEVKVREIVKVPDTSPRLWSGHSLLPSWTRWSLRNKTVQGEVIPRRQFQNNLFTVFPPDKYAKTHPEYYPLIDGKRWIPPQGYNYWRPCESNPDVVRITVEHARRLFDRKPELDSFSLGMDDVSHLCSCPNCRAMDPRRDSYEKQEFSDRHYKFVNTVAREIAKTHPDRYIGTLMYAIARTPPETVPSLEPNVFGYITEVAASWCNPSVREADRALTREWAKRCRHLSRYDYFGLGTFTPRYYPHAMAEQMRFDKSLGMEGMFAELNTFLPHTAPMIWAFAKMQWDASLDVDALLGEYFTKMFGVAAPTVARYFELLERAWNEAGPARPDWEHRNIFIQAQAISPVAVNEGMALLTQAMEEADSDAVRARIETIRAALYYAGLAIRGYAISERIIQSPVNTPRDAEQVSEQVLALMRLSAEREPFWAAAMDRTDLLGQNLRALAGKSYLMVGRVPNLERGATIGAQRVLEWSERNAPQARAEFKTKLTESIQGGVSDVVRASLWLSENKPANLLRNGGFEAASSAPASGPADRDRIAPIDWKTEGDMGRARFSRVTPGRTGVGAVSISQARAGAIYVQTHEVQAGQRLLCTVYAKGVPDGVNVNGYLSVRFQKPNGTWHSRVDLEPQVYMTLQDGWQPLMFVAKVPEGAARLVFMLASKTQPQGASVQFDDAGLYLLPEDR